MISSRKLQREQQARQEARQGVLFWLATGLAIVLLAGVALFFILQPKPAFDKITGCPIEHGEVTPTGHSVIMIDKTDPLSSLQADAVRSFLGNIIHDIKPGHLISLYAIGESLEENRKPLFEMCKLRDGSDAGTFTENELLLKRKFKKKFELPLENTLAEITGKTTEARHSPLFESIQAVAITSFAKWNVQDNRSLHLFSDMIHFTPEFSMFTKTLPDFSTLRNSDYGASIQCRLPGIEVNSYVFMNYPDYQKQRLYDFWKAYFRQSGAMISVKETLPRKTNHK